MASAKSITQIPAGFVPLWTLVNAEERIDDSLACVAMLTKQELSVIKEQAYKFGLPKFGPAWVYNEMIAKLLYQYGLVGSAEKEANSLASLPDVAILTVDWSDEMGFGRSVLWTHIRGTESQQAFNFITDPSPHTPDELRISADFRHLRMGPTYQYIEVTPRKDTAVARKGK